jgi:hypothetical protein
VDARARGDLGTPHSSGDGDANEVTEAFVLIQGRRMGRADRGIRDVAQDDAD